MIIDNKPLSKINELKRLKTRELGLKEGFRMEREELKRYSQWVETNPVIPSGLTHIQAWKEQTKDKLLKWL